MDIEALFDAGFAQHQAGNLNEAQALYQQVLEADPLHSDALHLMGVLALQVGELVLAEQLIQAAINIKPTAAYFGNLGLVMASAGNAGAAMTAYRRAVDLRADFAEAHNNLGNVLRHLGHLPDAIAAYRRAIEANADFSEAHNNLGIVLFDMGEVDAAIVSFRRAAELHPESADARNNLGIGLSRKGEWQKAGAAWREAVTLRHDYPEAHNNLGNALKQLGKLDEAVAHFRIALQLQPRLPEAHNNLGVIFQSRGQLNDAIASYRSALIARPDFADAYYNLAIALHLAGDLVQAIDTCRQAINCHPDWPEALNNLGIWLGEDLQHEQAIAAFDAAISARPIYAEPYNNRGNVLRLTGRLDDAIDSYQCALSIRPDDAEAWNNLGAVFKQRGKNEEAISAFGRSLAIQPDLAEAHNNLGNVLKDQGELDGALACYERAVELRPQDAAADSNRIYTLHFHPRYTGEMILAEHRRWNQRHAIPLQSLRLPHDNDWSPDRKLRIGYIAPDFRDHCQSLFTVPLLSHHDHGQAEIYCYSDVAAPDAVTERLRGYADVWHNIVGMSDDRVAAMIRNDRIDILVDLTVHMSHHRLAVFAQKAAPVQVTWLGYPGTTGLDAMDYRLSDPFLDPPENDALYTEKTIRLPESFWCYDPLTHEPEPNELPAVSNGFITFGCLNNFCKINDDTLRLWGRVMRSTPRSRLLLLAPEGSARRRVLDVLKLEQIDAARVKFSGRLSRRRYLELYHRIDLGLDTFPYNGHTTSLDSMWMGVPVVTRAGQTAVSRGGLSQLCNLGLSELAAASQSQFFHIASKLAGNVARLRNLRSTLRDRLEHSPLMDAGRFARNMEAAYRKMWKDRVGNVEISSRIEFHLPETRKRATAQVRLAS